MRFSISMSHSETYQLVASRSGDDHKVVASARQGRHRRARLFGVCRLDGIGYVLRSLWRGFRNWVTSIQRLKLNEQYELLHFLRASIPIAHHINVFRKHYLTLTRILSPLGHMSLSSRGF